MRNLFTVLLLMLLFLTSVAGIGGLLFMQFRHKWQMESLIDAQVLDEHATCLWLTPEEVTQLVWEKPEREFRYQGHMFDVMEMTLYSDGCLDITCIQDQKESAIERAITQALSQDQQGRSQQRSVLLHWFDFFNSLFFSVQDPQPTGDIAGRTGSYWYSHLYRAISQDIPGKPPEA